MSQPSPASSPSPSSGSSLPGGKDGRETLGSRLGFLFLSAGCAIGLGNVWRFPFITGQYGGALFVAVYLFFLIAVGLPILIMEFSVGRAARRNMGDALRQLEPKGARWHRFGWFSLAGSYLLMMFYIPVAGWMLYYCQATIRGELALPPEQVGAFFGEMLSEPAGMIFWAWMTLLVGFGVCWMGVRKGLEPVVKAMMGGLLLILLGLAARSVTLPGALEGLRFYLAPDWNRAMDAGVWGMVNAAMTQAFFTLGLGVGSMLIFASYLDRRRTLTGEATLIVGLDTFVAFTAGLIIFPACFAFGVKPDSGPGLVFITLPNIFNSMPGGRLWGTLFFVFMSFAALTTVISVVENIISYSMDVWGWSRRKSTLVNGAAMALLVLPCILGFNVWSAFQPLGPGTGILDLEDFLISNTMLPPGALIFLLFCCTRYGWGWKNFIAEADMGVGLNFPRMIRPWLIYVLPVLIVLLFVMGYVEKLRPVFG